MGKYDCLKLENQICFPLYACSKEITKKYRPLLSKLDLTYTQYITMLILWEEDQINIKSLGEKLYLDSGTLSPMLKNLESKGYIEKQRNAKDERNLVIKLTQNGKNLRESAVNVPYELSQCVNLSPEEARTLYKILYKILDNKKEK